MSFQIAYNNHLNSTQQDEHEVVVISFEYFDKILEELNFRQEFLPQTKVLWKKFRTSLNSTASYAASADDIATATRLLTEVGISSRFYIKSYKGNAHVILKGNQRFRNFLAGTRYNASHKKIISMAIGYKGAVAAAKGGGIVTIVLLTSFHIADYVLADEMTLWSLIGSIASDVAKVGIVVSASAGLAFLFGTFSFTIGPIVAVVLAGIFGSLALNETDTNLELTKTLNKLIEGKIKSMQFDPDTLRPLGDELFLSP